MNAGPRYAIYYAPAPASTLWRFGAEIIGYDAISGAEIEQRAPMAAGLDWRAITREPSRYGFHATLKAPFHLREDQREGDLLTAVENLRSRLYPILLGQLRVAALGPFVALVADAPRDAITDFAAKVVSDLEPYRAPLDAADIARRLESPLTARQKELLSAYGYPYVFEEYRFHMTLTGPLPVEQRALALGVLAEAFAARVEQGESWLDALVVFRQSRRDMPFHVLSRFELTDAADRGSPS